MSLLNLPEFNFCFSPTSTPYILFSTNYGRSFYLSAYSNVNQAIDTKQIIK